MAVVEVRGLVKEFAGHAGRRRRRGGPAAAGVRAIDGVDLSTREGEYLVLLGPSGCGKTTLLRTVAGLEQPTEGDVLIDGEAVTGLPPRARKIAMVFQSYALYPHMSVYQNLAFGLETARFPRSEIEARVQRAAEILRIEPLLKRKPRQLSGGQRQRVAIGRAIVREPRIFLFDEPLSNLDAELRVQMRVEIAKLHHDLGNTMIYVTHDQVEAMTMATRICVLSAGNIEQVGTPYELYNFPRNRFVATFIGSPKMNLMPVTDGRLADFGALDLPTPPAEIGIRLYKVGMPWPLERDGVRHFAEGLEEILVVEEKRAVH